MLVATISGPDIEDQIRKASLYADILEFRWDLYPEINPSVVKSSNLPVIFTCRKNDIFSDEKRLDKLRELLSFKPDYVDLEEDLPKEIFEEFSKHTKVICSYHNFENTPEDLNALIYKMQKKRADVYKIATFATSSLDCIKMLQFVKEQKIPTSGMCMGPLGGITRILGPVFGNFFDYCCIENPVVEGQLSLNSICDIYRNKSLNRQTKIYALLGDPVDKSVGHKFHNSIFSLKEKNAVYIKILLKDFELEAFFKLIDSLNFCGFSVTMPLKEKIIPFVDKISLEDQKIGSINTLIKKEGMWIGSNTDGKGALKALQEHMDIENKKIVIFGAGGSSKALIQAFLKKKAQVIIVNRTKAKALALAENWGCKSISKENLSEIIECIDLIVNTTPDASMFLDDIRRAKKAVVMDIVSYPIMTCLIKNAKKNKLRCVFGYEMFIHQAYYQQKVFS